MSDAKENPEVASAPHPDAPTPADPPAAVVEPQARSTIRVGGVEVGPDWPGLLSPDRFPFNLVSLLASGHLEMDTGGQGGGVSKANPTPDKGEMASAHSSPPWGNRPCPESRPLEFQALPTAELLKKAQAQIAASDKAELWGLHIQARGVTLVSGQTSAGKTTLLHTLAYCLAEGREFLGIQPPRPLRVLYVDCESSLDVLVEHFTRIGASANLYVVDPDYLPKGDTLLGALKAKVPADKYDVVIVDPLMVAYPVPDENDNARASEQMEHFKELARETQVGIVLVHNTGRKALDGGHEAPFAARGASARTDRADVALTLHKGEGTRRSLEVVKSRRKNFGDRIAFEFEGELGYRLLSGTDSQPTRGPAPRDWRAEAVQVVREEHADGRSPTTRKTIQERVGIVGNSAEDRALTRALKDAVARGQLTQPARGHYALPTAGQPTTACQQVGPDVRRLDHEADEQARRQMVG